MSKKWRVVIDGRPFVHQESLFCPSCGAPGPWVIDRGGDYYVGPEWFCVKCRATWTMQGPVSADDALWTEEVDELTRAVRHV